MRELIATGRILGRRAVLRWADGNVTGTPAAVARARALARRKREAVLAGLAGGPATLDAGARPALIAATLAESLDKVERIDGLEPEPVPDDAAA